MNPPTITVGGHAGFVFEGEISDTFCFVPLECVTERGEGWRVDEGDYVRSGWDVRNMRFSSHVDGQHLFPRSDRPVDDLNSARVQIFVDRIKGMMARLTSQTLSGKNVRNVLSPFPASLA